MTHEFKNVFISYGRRESLGFAARLHQQLKLPAMMCGLTKSIFLMGMTMLSALTTALSRPIILSTLWHHGYDFALLSD